MRIQFSAALVGATFVLAISTAPAVADPTVREARFRSLHGLSGPRGREIPQGPGAWYEFRNGPQNRGVSPFAIRDLPGGQRAPWAFATKGLIWGTPVIDHEGNIYVGSADKVFYGLTAGGQKRWAYTLPDAGDALVDSAAVLTPDGLVVVPGGDGKLHALKKETGELVWRFAAHHASDHESGVKVNSFEGNVTLGPDGLLYAGSDNGYLYCVDPAGRERWSFRTGFMIWSAVAFCPDGRWLTFGSLDGRLYVLDRSTGACLASFKAGGEFKGSPAVAEDGRIFAGNADFSFRCLELSTGTFGQTYLREVWRLPTRGEIYSSPAIKDGRVVFASHDGYLYCATLDGKLSWRYGIHQRVSASPLITADGVVMVGAKNGKLYAVDLATGLRLWSFKTAPGMAKVNLDSSPALTPDGIVVAGSYDGRLYGVPVEYPATHPDDPRCQLDPGPDLPEFGQDVPMDGATLRFQDDQGQFPAGPAEEVSPVALLTYRLVARRGGQLISNAAMATCGLRVRVEPPDPVEMIVSSDGYSLTLAPGRFFRPGTSYRVTIEGRYYERGNPFVDLLKWFNLPLFTATTTFRVRASGGPLPVAGPTTVPAYGIRKMYIYQPEILDTLIPAAMEGQAFIATVPYVCEPAGTLSMLLLPAYPRPDGVVLRAAPEKVFVMNGRFQGDRVAVEGDFTMSAMGSTIPFAPLRFYGRLTQDRIEEGRIHASASVLAIKGNGSTYTGLSWSSLDDLADAGLRLQALGTIQGERIPSTPVPVKLCLTRWLDAHTLAVELDLERPLDQDHLLTALVVDTGIGRVTGQTTVVLPRNSGPGAVTATVGRLSRSLATSPGVRLQILVDGQPL
ncbi:MAG: PQQ-binding-like beta-propeller repeat protein [Candidatus Riflebacteria bacterium]|nr:PQQ-binding-like beta-propeller repeat protein [Candidatus Riflebacteria bacterium]